LELDTNATNLLEYNLEGVVDIIKQMEGALQHQPLRDSERVDEQEEVWLSLSSNMAGFAQHELLNIQLDYNFDTKLDLECVSSLSPIHMVHLSNGSHTATGHKVWMVFACFFKRSEAADAAKC
jgi:hypothetical protein